MWEAKNNEGYCTVHSPDKQIVLFCFDRTFARRLARILNSTSMYKFWDSEEEMDMRGVPRNEEQT